MRNSRICLLILSIATMLLIGCGGGKNTNESQPYTPLAIISQIPADAATSVAITSVISAALNKEVDSTTINTTNFTVTSADNTTVNGTLAYNQTAKTITFTPSAPLAYNTTYTVTVKTAIKDNEGSGLTANHTSTFKTTALPTFTHSPAAGSTALPVSTVISATASKSLDPATVTSTTVTVSSALGPVTGTVAYNSESKIITFTPTALLFNNTTYSVILTTGIKDTEGNALAGNDVWNFTTAYLPRIISHTPSTAASSVSVSPVISATVNKPLDPTTVNRNTVTVTSALGAVNGTVTYDDETLLITFTPTTSLVNNTVYTVSLKTGIKDNDGGALEENEVWSFATTSSFVSVTPAPRFSTFTPTDGSTNVSINPVISAVSSRNLDASTVNNTNVTVSSGVGAVTGTVAYNSTTKIITFTPTAPLFNNTNYTVTLKTGIKDTLGTALAEDNVWSFSTSYRPSFSDHSPAAGANTVPVSTTITATASKPLDPTTVNASTVTVTSALGAVSGTVSYDAETLLVKFTPSANLINNTVYTVTLKTGIKDTQGRALEVNDVWNFSTSNTFTTTTPAPTFTALTPTDGSSNVSVSTTISAMASRDLDPATVSSSTVTVFSGVGATTGTVTYDAPTRIILFTPSTVLFNNTTYTVTLKTGIKDTRGTALAQNTSWSFTTSYRPRFLTRTPAVGASNVDITLPITATASKQLDPSTVNTTNVTVSTGVGTVNGTVAYDDATHTVTFTPASNLLNNTVYTVTLKTGIKDTQGNALQANDVWSFSTAEFTN
ncbi:MAG: Ig-like domain-containing protein [Pseudomonadota bacterium]